jgi:hydroxymethylglutaryl-CoA lyase
MTKKLKIIECPRDAMQGIAPFIATKKKVSYLNKLLGVGFGTLDFGSFVSPRAVPQMADTAEVVSQLDLATTMTNLLAIIANLRGAEEAAEYAQIKYLGYPMSISETFQLKNTNKTIVQSLEDLARIGELCKRKGKELVVYISMAYGNPYGDNYSSDIVAQFADILVSLGATVISLADTVGLATPKDVENLFTTVKTIDQQVEWGVHLHAAPRDARAKIEAALTAGCRRIDGAILGYGGCPMADNELVGNINTRTILTVAGEGGYATEINQSLFNEAELMASTIFKKF